MGASSADEMTVNAIAEKKRRLISRVLAPTKRNKQDTREFGKKSLINQHYNLDTKAIFVSTLQKIESIIAIYVSTLQKIECIKEFEGIFTLWRKFRLFRIVFSATNSAKLLLKQNIL